jgi:hypothetical protein
VQSYPRETKFLEMYDIAVTDCSVGVEESGGGLEQSSNHLTSEL